jgi:hypothetical protein
MNLPISTYEPEVSLNYKVHQPQSHTINQSKPQYIFGRHRISSISPPSPSILQIRLFSLQFNHLPPRDRPDRVQYQSAEIQAVQFNSLSIQWVENSRRRSGGCGCRTERAGWRLRNRCLTKATVYIPTSSTHQTPPFSRIRILIPPLYRSINLLSSPLATPSPSASV